MTNIKTSNLNYIMERNLKGRHLKAVVPDPTPFTPPVFNPTNQLSQGKAYLEEHGYACYGPVVTPEEIETAISLLWDYLEGLGTGIARANPATWKNENWLPDGGKGILYTNSIGQSKFLWYLRQNPLVARVFASIWQCELDNLLTSFDGACIMRPVSFNSDWKTASGWYRTFFREKIPGISSPASAYQNFVAPFYVDVDQNGVTKPNIACYQGLVNLLEAGKDAPGLVVCPGSHHKFRTFFEENPGAGQVGGNLKGDFVSIKPAQLVSYFKVRPIKLCVPAGALVIWDSRTIHCNTPAANNKFTAAPKGHNAVIPDRIVAYICMSPRPSQHHILMNLLKQKRKAVHEGITTNHWPDEFHPSRTAPPRVGDVKEVTYEYEDITDSLTEWGKKLAGIVD